MDEDSYERRKAAHDRALIYAIASGQGHAFDAIADRFTADAETHRRRVRGLPTPALNLADEPSSDDDAFFGDLPF